MTQFFIGFLNVIIFNHHTFIVLLQFINFVALSFSFSFDYSKWFIIFFSNFDTATFSGVSIVDGIQNLSLFQNHNYSLINCQGLISVF